MIDRQYARQKEKFPESETFGKKRRGLQEEAGMGSSVCLAETAYEKK